MHVWRVYQKLFAWFGPQGWWPIVMTHDSWNMTHRGLRIEHGLTYGIPYSRLKRYCTPFRDPYFEIAVGAILTQNTAWRNVAMVIQSLYRAKALTPARLLKLHPRTLQSLLRPTGYYRQKAKKLRGFSRWLIDKYQGKLERLKNIPLPASRSELLRVWGIGKETADSILLYALNKPIFVVDAYTRRFCSSHGVEFDEYDGYRVYFKNELRRLPTQTGVNKRSGKLTKIYQEYHALLVAWGKQSKSLNS